MRCTTECRHARKREADLWTAYGQLRASEKFERLKLMSVNNGSVNTSRYVPDTPDQFRGSAGSTAASSAASRRNLDSWWPSRFLSRRVTTDLKSSSVVHQLDFSGASSTSRSSSLGNEMSAEEERETLHKRQEEILNNPKIAQDLHVEACNRVLGMPEVRSLVEEQVRFMAGDPEVMRQFNIPDDSTKPAAESFDDIWIDDVPITDDTDLDNLEARTRRALTKLGKKMTFEPEDLAVEKTLQGILERVEGKRTLQREAEVLRWEIDAIRRRKAPGAAGILGSGGIGRLQQLLSDASLDATAALSGE